MSVSAAKAKELTMEALRKCRECGLEAHTQEELLKFVQDSSRLRGCRTICNICNNNKYYDKKQKAKKKAIEYKGGKCSHCGLKYDQKNGSVFDFHHTNPKEKEIKPATVLGWSWDSIKKEIDKCILLCSNCHRIEHNKEY